MQQHSSQQGQHACQANLLHVCHTRAHSCLLRTLPKIKKVPTVTVATGAAAKHIDAGDYPHLLKLYAVRTLHLTTCYNLLEKADLPACTHYFWMKTNGQSWGGGGPRGGN